MALLNFLKRKRSVVVVDIVSMLDSLGSKENSLPRLQLQILRRLVKLSEKENIKIIAVLSGQPLNKAPKGKKFDNILVLYSSDINKHAKKLSSVAVSYNSVLVTNNELAEKIVGSKVHKMRISTFRKIFDFNSDFDFKNSDSYRRGNRSRNRFNKDRNQKGYNSLNRSKNDDSSDTINELIDLVE